MSERLWYKGNLHTHTTKSDGDADPEVVAAWYERHDYDFLALSDHNHRTILDHQTDDVPLMIPGEEVSVMVLGGEVPFHLNGIGLSRVVEPIDAGVVAETIQANVNAIIDAGALPRSITPTCTGPSTMKPLSRSAVRACLRSTTVIPKRTAREGCRNPALRISGTGCLAPAK